MYNIDFRVKIVSFTWIIILANFRDPNGGASSIKGIRLNVCDVGWRPPQTVLAKKMLTDAVSSFNCDKTKLISINGIPTNIIFDSIRHVWSIHYRNHQTWHSIHTTMVRTMARNVPIRSISSWSWVHASFSELPNCSVQFGSESAGECKQFDAKSPNDAECNAAKIAEVAEFRYWNSEQLRYAAWRVSRGYNEVSERGMTLNGSEWSLIDNLFTELNRLLKR